MEDQSDKRTETTPKGLEVPVPKRGEFFGNLQRVALPDVAEQIEQRRNDPEFRAKLKDAVERDREALDLLAKGDEDQPDL